MIDHYQRIHALHQQELENAEIELLEKQVAPLIFAVLLVVAAVVLATLIGEIDSFIKHYNSLAEVNDAMVQCMNGHAISLGDAQLNCEIREYKKLVIGLSQGDQL